MINSFTALLITDGEGNKDQHLTKAESDTAKRQGIELYGLGMYLKNQKTLCRL